MIRWRKRGVSPVIATVLLVVVALILAVIIFLWARSFVGESVQKQERDIEQSCAETSFRAEIILDDGFLFVENVGRVPLYGAEMRKKQVLGEVTKVGTFDGKSIQSGETSEISLGEFKDKLEDRDSVIIVPVLLGETDQARKAYVCNKESGIEITVRDV
jgi:flagellin-like protein